MKYYFAYGSNMNKTQFAHRCPDSQHLGIATLPGYEFIITSRGYASIMPNPAETVIGVLCNLSPAAEAILDYCEGAGEWMKPIDRAYRKDELIVLQADATPTLAMTYIDTAVGFGWGWEPYWDKITAGLRENGIPKEYLFKILKNVKSHMIKNKKKSHANGA